MGSFGFDAYKNAVSMNQNGYTSITTLNGNNGCYGATGNQWLNSLFDVIGFGLQVGTQVVLSGAAEGGDKSAKQVSGLQSEIYIETQIELIDKDLKPLEAQYAKIQDEASYKSALSELESEKKDLYSEAGMTVDGDKFSDAEKNNDRIKALADAKRNVTNIKADKSSIADIQRNIAACLGRLASTGVQIDPHKDGSQQIKQSTYTNGLQKDTPAYESALKSYNDDLALANRTHNDYVKYTSQKEAIENKYKNDGGIDNALTKAEKAVVDAENAKVCDGKDTTVKDFEQKRDAIDEKIKKLKSDYAGKAGIAARIESLKTKREGFEADLRQLQSDQLTKQKIQTKKLELDQKIKDAEDRVKHSEDEAGKKSAKAELKKLKDERRDLG